jgi:hypothetical protein
MLFHLSFNARDPHKVGAALAELLGAQVIPSPSPPFNPGALFVCCGDDRGTMVSIEPWGVTYEPGPGHITAMPDGRSTSERNAFHGLFMAAVPEERVLAIAEREGWPAARVDNGPFEVINVWVEGNQRAGVHHARPLPGVQGHLRRRGREVARCRPAGARVPHPLPHGRQPVGGPRLG